MKLILPLFLLLLSRPCFSQELFVSTEPASSLPAKSIDLKISGRYFPFDRVYDRPAARLTAELKAGLTKKWMVSLGRSFSDMHTYRFKYESYFFYTKYRFLSHDDVHRHFRMAAFLQASHTDSPFHYDEVGLTGDKSGIEAGLIATRLSNRFALSASVSHAQLLDASRFNKTVYVPRHIYEVMNYSLSSGYLLFPKNYSGYRQLGINLYMELLAQQALDGSKYFAEAAPALQLVFFSTTRLNAGYRFQLAGNAQRMSKNSWVIGIEQSFLNVWKRRKGGVSN